MRVDWKRCEVQLETVGAVADGSLALAKGGLKAERVQDDPTGSGGD